MAKTPLSGGTGRRKKMAIMIDRQIRRREEGGEEEEGVTDRAIKSGQWVFCHHFC